MNEYKNNPSIGCNVCDCVHHNNQKNSCSLSSIQVGRCGPVSNNCSCTECDSFQKKASSNQ